MTTNNNTYEINWDDYHNRNKDEMRIDILHTCFHNRIHPKVTSQILFSAGFTMKAKNIRKFFDGREEYLDRKKAENKSVPA